MRRRDARCRETQQTAHKSRQLGLAAAGARCRQRGAASAGDRYLISGWARAAVAACCATHTNCLCVGEIRCRHCATPTPCHLAGPSLAPLYPCRTSMAPARCPARAVLRWAGGHGRWLLRASPAPGQVLSAGDMRQAWCVVAWGGQRARQGARRLARRGPFLRNGAALRTETLCASLLGVLLFLPVTR